jgi:hypothetical protein
LRPPTVTGCSSSSAANVNLVLPGTAAAGIDVRQEHHVIGKALDILLFELHRPHRLHGQRNVLHAFGAFRRGDGNFFDRQLLSDSWRTDQRGGNCRGHQRSPWLN